ncbi:MAG: chemotaxis protein CheA [Nevskia sp.]|nr:chemotaxis protein CheA [Nevskia sp.]
MYMERVLQTFIAESRDLLADTESALLRLEKDPGDHESIAAVFRAVHTIKGSGGLVDFNDVVAFAHVVETLLDHARSGRLAVNAGLVALLLECADHLGRLIERHVDPGGADDALLESNGKRLLVELARHTPGASQTPIVAPDPEPAGPRLAGWHISVRFGADVFRRGLEPASFVRHLATLGEIRQLVTTFEGMPAAADMNPESCHLRLEIDFHGDIGRAGIEEVFDFLCGDCRLAVLPHHAQFEDYGRLLAEAGAGRDALARTLVAGGALGAEELARLLPPPVAAEEPRRAGPPPAADKRAAYVRVEASRLEELIDQVGEMVIATASATLRARRQNDGALNEAMSLLQRMVEQVRDSALNLRMVQIGETFRRFPRVVHDVGRELGKDISLQISGEEAELDKTVVEKVADPLMHLVRNAMDHGIEPAAERTAAGKPAAGTLRLDAYHESGSIVIEVTDDGAGLRRDKILRKAVERGLVEAGRTLGDAEVLELIFQAGFSTADKVSNLSGRGVGLDVVRRNIEALRGTIEVDSRPGQGTTFRIRLPLTLAIIDGFLVAVGNSSFVMPLDMVVECLELPEQTGGLRYLERRGEVLPLIDLREALAVQDGTPSRRRNVVVVHAGSIRAGLVVDRLLGEFQTVIKPLGQVFRYLRGISGSTILGSGEVALILDAPALVQQAVRREARHTNESESL